MNQPVSLTLEQQFELIKFQEDVRRMSHTQAQEFLVRLYEQMLVKDAVYRDLLKHQWGIGNCTPQ